VAATIYEFGDFKLDSARFELSRAGRSLKLERKPMELLILLAAREGELVTRAEIIERLWGSEVFVDTEHGINTAIRKIRQVLRDDSEQPRFVQTVMGKGYRFVGPVVAVGAAPAYVPSTLSPDWQPPKADLPPSDIPQDLPGKDASPVPRRPHLLLWIAASAVLTLLIVGVSLRARSWGIHAKPRITSLAVLPLDNLSGDRSQDYFADGMTDELTTMLAKNSTLRVTSRTSAMEYKGAHRPLREIAQALGVDAILEGSVARADGKVHMTIQLIQASTDAHVWAESYDRDANDVVTLPEEAARAIAKRLNSTAPTLKPARYVSPEAHEAYLHGQYLWLANQNDEAGKYFKKATELQPDYALGWAGLANYYGAGAVDSFLDPRQSLPAEDMAASKSVELDDSLAEPHIAMSAALLLHRWDHAGAYQEILRAIGLNPQLAEAHHFRAKILAALNRHPEAIEEQKKAMALDPFGRPFALGYSYQLARQYDDALTDTRQRLESSPHDVTLYWNLFETYRCKGMLKESVEAFEQILQLQGDTASAQGVRHAFEQGGYNAVLHWRISKMERESAKQYISPADLAFLYAQLGQRDKTLVLLEEAYRQHAPQLLWIQGDPAFDFLHTDERYRSIIQKMGLPPAW
jgi:TolB-like protein/DNA-binding winged helix-turn-helix (wHTH) protein